MRFLLYPLLVAITSAVVINNIDFSGIIKARDAYAKTTIDNSSVENDVVNIDLDSNLPNLSKFIKSHYKLSIDDIDSTVIDLEGERLLRIVTKCPNTQNKVLSSMLNKQVNSDISNIYSWTGRFKNECLK
tara:strand:+ start:5745 stop:6134 length:390 start_codon:yes stop_codon:yes gene_type:complete